MAAALACFGGVSSKNSGQVGHKPICLSLEAGSRRRLYTQRLVYFDVVYQRVDRDLVRLVPGFLCALVCGMNQRICVRMARFWRSAQDLPTPPPTAVALIPGHGRTATTTVYIASQHPRMSFPNPIRRI